MNDDMWMEVIKKCSFDDLFVLSCVCKKFYDIVHGIIIIKMFKNNTYDDYVDVPIFCRYSYLDSERFKNIYEKEASYSEGTDGCIEWACGTYVNEVPNYYNTYYNYSLTKSLHLLFDKDTIHLIFSENECKYFWEIKIIKNYAIVICGDMARVYKDNGFFRALYLVYNIFNDIISQELFNELCKWIYCKSSIFTIKQCINDIIIIDKFNIMQSKYGTITYNNEGIKYLYIYSLTSGIHSLGNNISKSYCYILFDKSIICKCYSSNYKTELPNKYSCYYCDDICECSDYKVVRDLFNDIYSKNELMIFNSFVNNWRPYENDFIEFIQSILNAE